MLCQCTRHAHGLIGNVGNAERLCRFFFHFLELLRLAFPGRVAAFKDLIDSWGETLEPVSRKVVDPPAALNPDR